MKAILKTKCGAEREIDIPTDRQGRPPEHFAVPIILSEPLTTWMTPIDVSPIGPTYRNRVFRCEYRNDEYGRIVYSEQLSVSMLTELESWEANIEWPSEIR